jgi:hypothetical protein
MVSLPAPVLVVVVGIGDGAVVAAGDGMAVAVDAKTVAVGPTVGCATAAVGVAACVGAQAAISKAITDKVKLKRIKRLDIVPP